MLERKRLIHAIEVQQRSYRLLLWIGEAIKSGVLPAEQAQHHYDTPDATISWFQGNYPLLPLEVQPKPDELREFATFFWTYITSSFEVDSRAAAWPHLKPMKLRPSDKQRAQELMCDRVRALAKEEGLVVGDDRALQIVTSDGTRRLAGFSTYGKWLINRLDGDTAGPAVLALWREIAWKREGSPIRGFGLRYEDFADAEQALVRALSAAD